MTPPATVAEGEAQPYISINFGIDAPRPPCIAALESDGAVHGDTVEALKALVLWQKSVINSCYVGKGSGPTPFESFLDGDVALPAGDHIENLIRWASAKCRAPISREDAEAIVLEVAESDLSFSCDRVRKLSPSVEEFCTPELCQRCKTKKVASDEKAGTGKGPSQATRLVELAIDSGAEFWRSEEGEAFISIPELDHIESHPLKSSHVQSWLSGLLFKAAATTPNGQAVRDALSVLAGMARYGGEVHPVFVRLADYEGRIYLDLGGPDWRAVEIGPDGWGVISSEEVPVKFRRSKGMLELPEPERGGNLEVLRGVLNVPEGDPWILAQAWLIQAFNPRGPYPIAVVNGEQGSAKSWFARVMRHLIDPNVSALRRPPRSERDLMIAAVNSWLIAYDNLSGLPPWLGDGICVLSTGGGLAQRELYSDREESLLDAQRPVILNGIDTISTRGDLLDRAIIFDLPRIDPAHRRTERDLVAELDRIRPGVIGAVLDVVSHGLRERANVRLASMPRLADFAEWIAACEGALGWDSGAFLRAYNENQNDANASLIENDRFATVLVEFINSGVEPFKGPKGLLLTTLEERANIDPTRPPDGWPRTPQGVHNKLKRITPALRAAGVEIVQQSRTNKSRDIEIRRVPGGGDVCGDVGDMTMSDTSPKKPLSCDVGDVSDVYFSKIKAKGEKEGDGRENTYSKVREMNVTNVTTSPHSEKKVTFGDIGDNTHKTYLVLEDLGTIVGFDGKPLVLKRNDLISGLPARLAEKMIDQAVVREVVSE